MNTPYSTVRREALEAYADSHPSDQPNAMTRRKLNWRAPAPISRDEAIAIMQETCPSYNEFTPSLLKKLPADAKVTLAREGSVCVYVIGVGTATAKSLKADEFGYEGGKTHVKGVPIRIWWD